ncbi:hypothetical protein SOVF_117980 [Spinacia oleracea]|nr:hypothetical protein SOVF_117980 [Spinacia oleracea]
MLRSTGLGETDRLRPDKQVLMSELVKLRQQQTNTRSYLQVLEKRLNRTEQKQKQMIKFLARALQSPDFLHQLAQQNDRRKELVEQISKKRRRTIQQGPSTSSSDDFGIEIPAAVLLDDVKDEAVDFEELTQFEDSELDMLMMEMQVPPATIEDTNTIVPQEEDILEIKHEEMRGDSLTGTLDDVLSLIWMVL